MTSPASDRILTLLQEVVTLVEREQSATPSGSSGTVTAPTHPIRTPTATVLSSPTSVLSELRSRFQPYPGSNNQRFRVAGRSAGRRNLTTIERTWSNKFFCLSGPASTKTPSSSERLVLAENDLGEKVITAGNSDTSEELKIKIVCEFSKLNGIGFELMRCVGAGGWGKPLIRISSSVPIPDVPYLKVSRISTIYIRPLRALILSEEEDAESEQSMTLDSTSSVGSASTEDQILTSTTITGASSVNDRLEEEEDRFPSMKSFQAKAHSLNPGIQTVRVFRENFLERLFGVYKDPTMNLGREIRVDFLGEAGADYGALTREYFWKGFVSLVTEKLDGRVLFEGEKDFLVPAADSKLLRTGVFRFVGKFIAHAAIHCGIGFLGLSEPIAEYLTTDPVTPDTPFSITKDDLPDPDHKAAIVNIERLQSGATLTHQEGIQVQELALCSDFVDTVTTTNAEEAIIQILYHQVIERRKSYLDGMKEAMLTMGLVPFIQKNPYLRSAVFPRMKDVNYPLSVVLDRIQYKGEVSVVNYVKDYMANLSQEKIPTLLKAWTGWSIIPESPLKITVEKDAEFNASTCFEEIFVPESSTKEDIKTWFDLLLENPEGFGTV